MPVTFPAAFAFVKAARQASDRCEKERRMMYCLQFVVVNNPSW